MTFAEYYEKDGKKIAEEVANICLWSDTGEPSAMIPVKTGCGKKLYITMFPTGECEYCGKSVVEDIYDTE